MLALYRMSCLVHFMIISHQKVPTYFNTKFESWANFVYSFCVEIAGHGQFCSLSYLLLVLGKGWLPDVSTKTHPLGAR